ncbi:alpha/beta hydrolase [candidate division KSB3 bacterium]|uniref:Alpha/beta hydrolase n=1 Tax=candidate division KSB3 bacterium TaxID=2044937 RepID=A0A2G6E2V5_9BACT|nr:MAG: alpha/beta hydrolase [candidate division KSB3 bacterium]PIE28814.1 MAG: alpha/beta hydrolase [candidate division KSB3 bacterium]
MPIVDKSAYRPIAAFKNCHFHTIYPSLFRTIRGVTFSRERISTPDDDFLDLDWARHGSTRLILTIHGLEGSSRSRYIPGMIKAFARRGWDGVALNLRGCSGEPNRLLRSYHSGATDDVETVITHILTHYPAYREIALIGFSLGGCLTLNYLGERGSSLPEEMLGAAAVSTPCDLATSAERLSEAGNTMYLKNFLRCFRKKIRLKMRQMPDKISDRNFHEVTSLKIFDDRYTAPIHGFRNAEDYWARCSPKRLLAGIHIPTLLLNALDDPFLAEASYPLKEAASHPYLFLEMPDFGGHVGFMARRPDGEYWHETRICDFVQTLTTHS